MKPFLCCLCFFFVACAAPERPAAAGPVADTAVNNDPDAAIDTRSPAVDTTAAVATKDTMYANQRFKEVNVARLNDSTFRISGKAQIFEARFGWVVEDGHNELQQGFESTDAGAPAWGNFSFTVTAKKPRANSTLHLVLFETSMKDGSRQHQLPVVLY